jgi:hypothetical protein
METKTVYVTKVVFKEWFSSSIDRQTFLIQRFVFAGQHFTFIIYIFTFYIRCAIQTDDFLDRWKNCISSRALLRSAQHFMFCWNYFKWSFIMNHTCHACKTPFSWPGVEFWKEKMVEVLISLRAQRKPIYCQCVWL